MIEEELTIIGIVDVVLPDNEKEGDLMYNVDVGLGDVLRVMVDTTSRLSTKTHARCRRDR